MALNNEHPADYKIRGRNFVLTGKLNIFTRDQATALLVERGGYVQRGVTSYTDILICGDNVGATKTNAARRHSVQMRSEQWLLAAIAANQPGLVPRKHVPNMIAAVSPSPEPQQHDPEKPKTRRVRVR